MTNAIEKLYEMGDMRADELVVCRTHADVPKWVEQDITCDQVAAILQGGCASGAYMPAVTYADAAETMAEHGDAVLDYLEERDLTGGDWFELDGNSWAGLACKVLSAAVEAWAHDVASAIESS